MTGALSPLPILCLLAIIAAGPGVVSANLRNDLEDAQATLEREHAALQEAYDSWENETPRRRAELERLTLEIRELYERRASLVQRRAELEKKGITAAVESDQLGLLVKRMVAAANRAVEYLKLHLSEIPGTEGERAEVVQLVRLLGTDEGGRKTPCGESLSLLTDLFERVHALASTVHVRSEPIWTAMGSHEEAEVLAIGHVGFAYRTADGRLGMALQSPRDASGFRWTEALPAAGGEELRRAFEGSIEHEATLLQIPIDLTRELRVDAMAEDESVLAWLRSGGPVMIPILLVAAIAVVLIAERAWALYGPGSGRSADAVRVLAEVHEGRIAEAEQSASRAAGTVGRTMVACLRYRDHGAKAMEDGIQEQLLREVPGLRRFLGAIATFGAVAPLLGLLGTVTGIITTFSVIRTAGDTSPALMAGGISEALVTTAAGLIIAIPILLFQVLLRGRADRILSDAERYGATLLNTLVHREDS
jgi:biopolymer transport protein ExbB